MQKHGITEVERRLQEQLPFLTATTQMLRETGEDPKEAELGPFIQLIHDMNEVLRNTSGGPGTEWEVEATAHELWHLTRFVAHGLRTYQVSPGLAELLIKTNVSRIPMEWIRLPFPSFYIQLPPEAGAYFHALSGHQYPVAGALVTSTDAHEQGLLLCIAFLAEGSPGSAHSATFSVHIPYESSTLADAMAWVITHLTKALVEGEAQLTPVTGCFKSRKQFLAQCKKDFGRLINLVANTILYATCENPEITVLRSPRSVLEKKLSGLGPKKRSKLQRQRARTSGLEQHLLGGSIVIQRGEREEAEYATATGRCVMVRHMVSGHWRHQAHGPNRELRRWTWIAPYFKGPDGAQEIVSRHILR